MTKNNNSPGTESGDELFYFLLKKKNERRGG